MIVIDSDHVVRLVLDVVHDKQITALRLASYRLAFDGLSIRKQERLVSQVRHTTRRAAQDVSRLTAVRAEHHLALACFYQGTQRTRCPLVDDLPQVEAVANDAEDAGGVLLQETLVRVELALAAVDAHDRMLRGVDRAAHDLLGHVGTVQVLCTRQGRQRIRAGERSEVSYTARCCVLVIGHAAEAEVMALPLLQFRNATGLLGPVVQRLAEVVGQRGNRCGLPRIGAHHGFQHVRDPAEVRIRVVDRVDRHLERNQRTFR
ncbi:hypothetical protein D3C86_1379300 [compost metagenome]